VYQSGHKPNVLAKPFETDEVTRLSRAIKIAESCSGIRDLHHFELNIHCELRRSHEEPSQQASLIQPSIINPRASEQANGEMLKKQLNLREPVIFKCVSAVDV
jgi:hypothetical protein